MIFQIVVVYNFLCLIMIEVRMIEVTSNSGLGTEYGNFRRPITVTEL